LIHPEKTKFIPRWSFEQTNMNTVISIKGVNGTKSFPFLSVSIFNKEAYQYRDYSTFVYFAFYRRTPRSQSSKFAT